MAARIGGIAAPQVIYLVSDWQGALQRKKIPKIRDYYGSGWVVGPGLTRIFFFWENRPKIPQNDY